MLMKLLDNILYSGHTFPEDENLEKYRFYLLNSLLLINIVFAFLGMIDSPLDIDAYKNLFLAILFLSFSFSTFMFLLLRKNKKYYKVTASILLAGMGVLFIAVLLVHTEDEFRLISFFFLLLSTYVLLGKKYGLIVGVLSSLVVGVLIQFYDMQLSENALKTFFIFIFVFISFLYTFMDKIEKDAYEFKVLNEKLEERVREEVFQRQEQEQMLLRQCRMANMGEMIDSIAHQWRQPLMNINAILMNMDILSEEEKKNTKVLDGNIVEISALTTHMSQTIEDFRTFYEEEKTKTNFNVLALIEDVTTLMKSNFRDISLSVLGEESLTVLGYKNELTQIFITLFSNATEVLKMRNIYPKEIVIALSQDKRYTYISIEDNAGGVRVKNMPSIFDPYYTTKKQTGGTGLGLYIAKIIMVQHLKGRIDVVNTAKGAKFILSLPHDV